MRNLAVVVLGAALIAAACSDGGRTRDDDDGSASSSAGGSTEPCAQVAASLCTDACACPESACSVEYVANGAYAPGNYADCYSYFEALYCNSTEAPWADVSPSECMATPIACGMLGAVLPTECGGAF
jgi:hypothetical protein